MRNSHNSIILGEHRPSLYDNMYAALHALRRRRAQTLAGEFLHQMHALSLTETEIETLLRETAQQQTEE